jgi:hypothetical protein
MFAPAILAALTLTLIGMLAALAALDFWFELKGWEPIGDRIQTWARRYPALATILALIAGATVSHFFWPK